jgi:hypothetical protein
MTRRSQSWPKKFPQGMEVEEGGTKTPTGDTVAAKNPMKSRKPIQKLVQEGGECVEERCTGRKKGHFPSTRRMQNGGYNYTRNPLDKLPHRKQGHQRNQSYT